MKTVNVADFTFEKLKKRASLVQKENVQNFVICKAETHYVTHRGQKSLRGS